MDSIHSQSSCFPMPPPPGVFLTGKMYTTGEKITALIGPFLTLMQESPDLVVSRKNRDLMKVVVELDKESSSGAIMQSLCFAEGIPVSYLEDKKPGDILTFTALYCHPMKLEYMGEKKSDNNG